MPTFSTQPPYIKQISLYFNGSDHKSAFTLSQEFASAFPNEMISHFLYAKAAFWLDSLDTAREEALIAFNMCKGEDDLAVAGILLSCIYYNRKEYEKGILLLNLLRTRLPQNEEIQKLKFIFALALRDEPAAMRHLESLYEINRKAASDFIVKFIE
jgi:hypothetical protein